MKHPILVIVLNCIAIVVLCSLLSGAILLHQTGRLAGFIGDVVSLNINLDDGVLVTDDSYNKGATALSAADIDSVDLGWSAGSVTVQVGEDDQIYVAETSSATLDDNDVMRWKVENGTLKVRYGKREGFLIFSFGFDDPEKHLTLTVPPELAQKLKSVEMTVASADVTVSEITAENLTVTSASGDVKLSDLTAGTVNLTNASGSLYGENLTVDNMDLDSASGQKEFVNCTVSDTLNCDSASGDFFFSGSLEKLDSDTASGDIELDLTAPAHSLNIDSASGDLTVTLPSDLPGLEVEYDSASGDMKFDFDVSYKGDDRVIYGDGSMKVEIDTASGDVEFKLD